MGRLADAEHELEQAWRQNGASGPGFFAGVLVSFGRAQEATTLLRANEASWREGRLATAADSFSGHCRLGNIRNDPRFALATRRLAEIEATGSPTRSVAMR